MSKPNHATPPTTDEQLFAALTQFVNEAPARYSQRQTAAKYAWRFCQQPPLGWDLDLAQREQSLGDLDIPYINLCVASLQRPLLARIDDDASRTSHIMQVLAFTQYDPQRNQWQLHGMLPANGRSASILVNASELAADLWLGNGSISVK